MLKINDFNKKYLNNQIKNNYGDLFIFITYFILKTVDYQAYKYLYILLFNLNIYYVTQIPNQIKAQSFLWKTK